MSLLINYILILILREYYYTFKINIDMTQEEKDLLIKDLCYRLPYGVKAYIKNWSKLERKYYEGIYTVASVHPSLNDIYAYKENCSVEVILGYTDYFIKPYLFPLDSMTEEQCYDFYCRFIENDTDYDDFKEFYFENNEWHRMLTSIDDCESVVDWYNKNHFDYRGIIPRGLANDATGLNIY